MKHFLVLSFSFLLMSNLVAQDTLKPKKIFQTHLTEVGAGLGLDAFGSSGLLVSFQPSVIVPLRERIHFGVTPNLTYFRDFVSARDDIIFGGSLFGRGYFSENFYGQLEIEALNANSSGISSANPRSWFPSYMIGAGYRKKIDIINTYVTTLYIVNYRNFNSVYPRPLVIRAGVTILLSDLKRNN